MNKTTKFINESNEIYNLIYKTCSRNNMLLGSKAVNYERCALIPLFLSLILMVWSVFTEGNSFFSFVIVISIISLLVSLALSRKSVVFSNQYIDSIKSKYHLENLAVNNKFFSYNSEALTAIRCYELNDYIYKAQPDIEVNTIQDDEHPNPFEAESLSNYNQKNLQKHIDYFKEKSSSIKSTKWGPIAILVVLLIPFWNAIVTKLFISKATWEIIVEYKMAAVLFFVLLFMTVAVIVFILRTVLQNVLLLKANRYQKISEYLLIIQDKKD